MYLELSKCSHLRTANDAFFGCGYDGCIPCLRGHGDRNEDSGSHPKCRNPSAELKRALMELRYLGRPPWDTRVSPPELESYIASHAPRAALDLGCGTGTNVITLARAGWRCMGVDFSRLAILRARVRAVRHRITATFLTADVTRPVDVADRFDLALDIGCLHGVEDRDGYLQNLETLLKDTGDWLLYAFQRDSSDLKSPGVSPSDLDMIRSRGWRLMQRQDGRDRRRASAWFLFSRTAQSELRSAARATSV